MVNRHITVPQRSFHVGWLVFRRNQETRAVNPNENDTKTHMSTLSKRKSKKRRNSQQTRCRLPIIEEKLGKCSDYNKYQKTYQFDCPLIPPHWENDWLSRQCLETDKMEAETDELIEKFIQYLKMNGDNKEVVQKVVQCLKVLENE